MLETFKACQDTDIPTKTIKENIDIFAKILLSSYNESIEKYNFLSSLRIANIKFVSKGDKNSKDNYRPFITLPNVFKIVLCLNSSQNIGVVYAKVTVRIAV